MRHSTLFPYALLLIILLLTIPLTVSALSSSDAKKDWYDARERSRETQEAHRLAKVTWAVNKTPDNNQNVIDTGKEALLAALDEAEAWLEWKRSEVEEYQEIPENLKATIREDVASNLVKIEELRVEVESVNTQLELGLAYLKMVGKYFELLTDVARNTGLVWVHLMNTHAQTVGDYEQELRDAAGGIPNNRDILLKLDRAQDELDKAETNIALAQSEYEQVRLPGTPLIKFSNGNSYLRIARGNLLSAHGYLEQAFLEISRG